MIFFSRDPTVSRSQRLRHTSCSCKIEYLTSRSPRQRSNGAAFAPLRGPRSLLHLQFRALFFYLPAASSSWRVPPQPTNPSGGDGDGRATLACNQTTERRLRTTAIVNSFGVRIPAASRMPGKRPRAYIYAGYYGCNVAREMQC